MKHFLQLTTTLILLMFLGGNAWGQTTYSHTITSKTWSAYGTENLTGVDWTAAATGGTYWGYDATKGQQFGSSGSPAKPLTLSTTGFAGVISSIKVSTSGASSVAGTLSVSVGGSALSPASISLTSTNTEYEFTGSTSGEVLITWTQTSSKALYLKKLEVTYSTGSAPPALTAAPSATVDAAFDVTFTDDIAWREAITSITVDGTTLTAGYSVATGEITFTPSASLPTTLLQTAGVEKSFVVIATGYTNATVSQTIGAGTPTKLGMKTQPAAPATNGAVLATQPAVDIQDQYGNTTTSTANVAAAVGAGTWTLAGTATVAASAGTATFTNLTATSAAAVSGATIAFTSGVLDGTTSDPFNIPAPPPPTITVSTNTLSGFTYLEGNGPSAEQTFTVEGSNLTADISIAATTNYEISETTGSGYTSPITLTQTDGNVDETTIYVRLKSGLSIADYNNEDITATSTGADDQTVVCSGSVKEPTIAYQSFESGSDNWAYTPNPVAFNNAGVWDVVTSSFHTFTTIPSDETHFWGVEDLNSGSGTTGFGTLTFTSVDVSAYTNVKILFDYEVDGFDTDDDVKYEAFFDNTSQGEVVLVDGSSNLNQDGTVSINVTAGVSNVYLVISVKQNGGDYGGFDNFKITGTLLPPSSVALSDNGTQIAAANVPQGTTDHVLHKFQLAVTDANASLTGMTCTTAGTYASSDITNLKVRYSTDATLDGADATLSTLTAPGTAGQKTFPTFTSQTIDISTTGYIFITADIAANATHGNTISIDAIATTDLTIANTTLTGSTTAGGAQTFQDETGPIVSTYDPEDDATEVAIGSNLVLTFDEDIQKGTTGDITIKKISGNSTVQTIAVTSGDVSIIDATLTINPSDLAIGTRYYVEIAAGAIEDIQGNDYAGISGTATWNFTTVAPSVTNVTSTNADGLYTIDDIITIRADFTANVSITTDGNPYILLDMVESDRQASYASGTGTSTLFFTYTIQDSDEAADLDYVANNSLYTNGGTITSDDGVAANRTLPEPGSGNSISGQKAIVVDGVRPSVTDYSPADGSTDVTLDQDLVLTFSENVQQGTSGTVTIYNGGGVVEFESIPFDDGRITISTNTVTINPTGTFSYASNYYVKISNNVITDENGNSYTGITDETTWNFTTESGPESLPLTESFDNSTFPANWTYMNFTIENSSNAGGSPYETRLQYTAANPGTSHLATPAINTSSETTLSLSWNQKVDFYEGGTGTDFIIQVLTSTDGTTYTNVTSQQTVTADETEQKTITLTADDGVGSGTLYIKWLYFQNNTNRFTSWFIDNVFLGLSEPSSHPTSFGALANGTDQIDLTWVDSDAEHYLIKGSTVDFDDITAPTDGVAEADGGLVKNVDAGTQAHSFTGLDANTTYYFKIFPYNGVTTMINYKIDGAQQAQAITADLYDRNSVVDGPETVSQPNPTLISSLVDTDGEAIRVFDMIVRDYGTSDGVDTKITQITINDGANNNADWSNEIQGIKLSVDGGSTFVTIGSPTIEAASIVVPIVSGNLDIPDGEALTVSLYIYLKTSGLTDNAIFEFMIDKDAHGFLADAAGSGFATTFTNSTISNEILLDVVTTKFVYDQQPSNVNVDEVMSPAVEISFTDANGNIDLDKDGAAATISLATTGTFAGSATTSLDATNGQATFDNLLFSAEGSGITITATDADGKAVPDLESQAFNVTNTSSTGKMIISEMCDPYDNYANDRYIEITNIDDVVIDLTGWSIDAIINDGSGVAFTWNLSGTLDPNESLTCGDTDNSVFTPDFAETDWSTSNSSWNGNEGDGAKLYDGSKALVDDAATPDGGSNYFENDAIIRLLRVSQPASPFNPGEWYAASVSTPSESTPGYHINVWTGGTDNSWTEPTNWSQGVTTKELCHAIIKSTAANMPTIAAKAAGDVHDILIEENATLLGQENLTVNGTAFVEKSFTGYSAVDGKDGWYAVSPPVNGMTIAGSHFEPVIDEDDFYVYDEATNYWLNYYDENPGTLFDQFDAATGYMVAYATANAGTKSFAGSLNSNASYVLNPANSNTAWNLIGNPYPSKVTWADVLNTDVSSPKVLNATSGAWEDMGTEIGVGQGIFVYAESGSSSLTFELADQSPGGSKKSGEFNDFVKLLAGFNDDLSVQLLLQANQDASQNYEWKYDARYFYPVTSIPYLCAVTNDDIWVSKYVFASGEETTIIPIHFTVNEEQEINFSIEDFDANVGISKLTIEDTKLNTFTVLSDGSEYAFTANPDDNEMRFKLHAETTTGIHEATIEGLTIYTHANTLYLNSDKAGNARVEMYNVTGQKVMAKKVVMDGLTQITPQLPTGWYVVKVSTGEGMATEKVFIK